MAIQVYVGTNTKRFNSTFQADWSGKWSPISVVLKQNTDIDRPIFSVYLPQQDFAPTWNGMYIPFLKAYYWITSIVSVGNKRYEISASMDVLATYRTDILNTSCFIEFGFNTDASGATMRLADRRQCVSMVPKVATTWTDISEGVISPQIGCYVLTAVGENDGVTAYALSHTQLVKLINDLNQDIGTEIDSLADSLEVFKFFTRNMLAQGSAISAIRDCKWIPFHYSAIQSNGNKVVYLGNFKTHALGKELNANTLIIKNTTLKIPWLADDWKRMNSQISVYIPFMGTISVPVEQCNNVDSLAFTWSFEVLSGTISVRVKAGEYTVYTGSADVSVPYAIGSSNTPVQNFVSGKVDFLSGMLQFGGGVVGSALAMTATGTAPLTGGEVAQGVISGLNTAVQGANNMVSGYMQSVTPVIACTGTLGGTAAVGQSMHTELTLLYYEPINDTEFQATYGHPVYQIGKPATGYCKTQGFSVSAAGARADEIAQINTMMDSGVFIE